MRYRCPTGILVAFVVAWSILLAEVVRWAPDVPATQSAHRDFVAAVVAFAWIGFLLPLAQRLLDNVRTRMNGDTSTVPGPASAARPGNRTTPPDLYDSENAAP